jgi:hypothetical protein
MKAQEQKFFASFFQKRSLSSFAAKPCAGSFLLRYFLPQPVVLLSWQCASIRRLVPSPVPSML